jgi:hypothetical protein
MQFYPEELLSSNLTNSLLIVNIGFLLIVVIIVSIISSIYSWYYDKHVLSANQ